MAVNFGKTAGDYAKHRAGFPPDLLVRLKPLGIGFAGQAVLDIGTGTGSLARQFAMQGCRVAGLDIADRLLQQARRLDREAGVAVDYLLGQAEALPLADAALDIVTAGQCWHWFDGMAAAAEALRVLRPGGAIVICHFDWLPIAGNMVELTERLIVKHNPDWHLGGGTGFYPRWLTDLKRTGFVNLESFSFDIDQSYSHDDWCGRIRASAGVAAVLPAEEVARFDAELRGSLAAAFPADPLSVPHRVWAVIGRAPGGPVR